MNAQVELAIESLDGSAQPAVLYLTPGEKLGPIDIGTQGNWRVHANGVAPKHAALYYDGARLCVMSLDESSPLKVHGQAVPTSWVVIRPPCEIEVGAARLSFGPAEQEDDETRVAGASAPAADDDEPEDASADKTRVVSKEGLMDAVARHRASSGMSITGIPLSRTGAVPPPPSSRTGAPDLMPQPPPSSPFASSLGDAPSGRMPAVGTVATRAPASQSGFDIPMPSSSRAPAPVPPPPMSGPGLSSSGFDHDAPTSGTSPTAPTPPSVPTPGTMPLGDFDVPVPHSGPTPPSMTTHGSGVAVDMSRTMPAPKSSSLAAMWKGMSFPQRATAILFLPMVAAVFVLFSDDPRLVGAPPAPTLAAAPPTAPSEAPSEPAPPEPPSQETVTDSGAEALDVPEQPAASATATDTTAVASNVPAPVPEPPAPEPPPLQRTGKDKKSLQRKAVDAVAAAAYEEAARYYEQLAELEPDNPAYAAAAAITRQKASPQPK